MEEHKKKPYKYKYCLVPLCYSTTIKTPDKIFIRLPKDSNRRLKWLKACRRDDYYLSPKSAGLHICEDHFDLQVDMENYMRFNMMGGVKKMKPGVVPHIFNCQPDRKGALAHPAGAAVCSISTVKSCEIHPNSVHQCDNGLRIKSELPKMLSSKFHEQNSEESETVRMAIKEEDLEDFPEYINICGVKSEIVADAIEEEELLIKDEHEDTSDDLL